MDQLDQVDECNIQVTKHKLDSMEEFLIIERECLNTDEKLSTSTSPTTVSQSAKDRMLLSTDSASCLLFTQTITSPMLTPSEEKVDFLKGFEMVNETNENSVEESEKTDVSLKTDESRINEGQTDEGRTEKSPDLIQNHKLHHVDHLDHLGHLEHLDHLEQEEQNERKPERQQRKETSQVAPSVRLPSIKTLKDQYIESTKTAPSDGKEPKLQRKSLTSATDVVTKCISKFEENVDTSSIDVNSTTTSATKSEYKKETSTSTKVINNNECAINNNNNHRISNGNHDDHAKMDAMMAAVINNNNNSKDGVVDDGAVQQVQQQQVQQQVQKKKKSKKSKSHSHEKENISVKSSFSKFDALQKKNVLHVRSSDGSKAQEKFNGKNDSAQDQQQQQQQNICKSCTKIVFQMEQIKAERCIFHKNCFRCKECNKQLTVDTYQSHEGTLYCKPHFKALFAPKVVEEDPSAQPSDKPDLGLEELQSLNVKERFQVFEEHQQQMSQQQQQQQLLSNGAVIVKRSPSILSKLARFQAKGMDVGVADDSLNGIPIEESSTEESDADDRDGASDGGEGGVDDADLVRARKVQKEKPFHFTGMSDVKNIWEQQGESNNAKDERREERKQEIQNIRNRLFMGKQGKMKELYQQAVMESETGANVKRTNEQIETVSAADTRTIKERFEKGEGAESQSGKGGVLVDDDAEVFESAISKKSRSIFLELDANASKSPQLTPSPQQRSSSKTESPEREVYRDPDVVRGDEPGTATGGSGVPGNDDDSVVAKQTQTAKKMLNKFRQMEEDQHRDPVPMGPKPLKRFTPPPEPVRDDEDDDESGDDDDSESIEDDEDGVDGDGRQHHHQQYPVDADLVEAQKAARAQKLRAKFEKWEANEIRREQSNASVVQHEFDDEQIESTKSLRARFESMKQQSNGQDNKSGQRVKVNRFVETSTTAPSMECCQGCKKRVYPLEKIAVHGAIYHKGCFKCMECHRILRMDTYTYNQGLLYCTPHFKRLFITKGNYDTAFGFEQHKEKWNASVA